MDRVWEVVHPVIALLIAALAGWVAAVVIGWAVRRAGRHRPGVVWKSLPRRCRRPFRATVVIAAVLSAMPQADLSQGADEVTRHLAAIALIAALAWLFVQLTVVVQDVAFARFDIDVVDNLHARQVRTQILVLRQVLVAVVVFVAIAGALMTFPRVRTLGASILASAGLLSIVAGLAAQTTLANLFAGIQIAVTDQIRIEDVVVVDQEWGRIEEITLTYVVVRTWDNRRLVLPVSWFTTNVFQNWTRHEARVIGSVLLHVDYTVPVEEVRAELHRLVQASPLWDGRDWVLQVVDSTPTTMVLRGLMSSRDAPSSWDLRCEVREKLLAYVRDRYPGSLPRLRAEVGEPGPPPGDAGRPAGVPVSAAPDGHATAQPGSRIGDLATGPDGHATAEAGVRTGDLTTGPDGHAGEPSSRTGDLATGPDGAGGSAEPSRDPGGSG
jgi:small-conductance mechanosensitive channel